jgi:hypothetical protein
VEDLLRFLRELSSGMSSSANGKALAREPRDRERDIAGEGATSNRTLEGPATGCPPSRGPSMKAKEEVDASGRARLAGGG